MPRRHHESAVASLMLAGIELAFSTAAFFPNRSAFRQAMEERGLSPEVWGAMFVAAVGLMLFSCLCPQRSRPRLRLRFWGLVLSTFAFLSTFAVFLFYLQRYLYSPFGWVTFVCGAAAVALLVLDARETHRVG